MKAIHNPGEPIRNPYFTVVNKAKIQNESNSQQLKSIRKTLENCC